MKENDYNPEIHGPRSFADFGWPQVRVAIVTIILFIILMYWISVNH